MSEFEQFEKLIKETRIRYFKKHFINNDINVAMYEAIKEILLELAGTTIKISLLINWLCTIRKNKKYFLKLDNAYQKRVKINIIGLKAIQKKLDNTLKPILQGLQAE